MTIKIALTGRMGAGKDTVAGIIDELLQEDPLGLDVMHCSFAWNVKEFFHMIFNDVTHEPKPRKHYQDFGQSMRQIDPDIWVKWLDGRLKQIEQWDTPPKAIIITDLRQENEYYYCKANGFHVVKVAAPRWLRIKRMTERGDNFSNIELDHETENGKFIPDRVIYNDADISRLSHRVYDLISSLTE